MKDDEGTEGVDQWGTGFFMCEVWGLSLQQPKQRNKQLTQKERRILERLQVVQLGKQNTKQDW